MRFQLLGSLTLLAVGVIGRLVPHPPNFTPMEATALFAGAWLPNIWLGLAVPISIMALTDALLGWHSLWLYTWGAASAGVLLGRYLMQKERLFSVAGTAIAQATLFFLITNFGVWTTGAYGYSLSGLIACYGAAIPFYHYQVLGALFYSGLFWVVEYTLLRRLQVAPR